MESVGLACVALYLPCLALIGINLIVGGGLGLLTTGRSRKALRIFFVPLLIAGLILTAYVGSVFIPRSFWLNLRPSYRIGDRKLRPYEHAITEIDRTSFGFTLIPENASIKIIENGKGLVTCPDVELYIPDLPFKRQHICLEMIGDTYVWHSEYEVYIGPENWETLWLAYSSSPYVLGRYNTPYTLDIDYRGPYDPRFTEDSPDLESVQPLIAEWREFHLSNP